MIPVLTKEQVYKLDKDTIESGHLSQAELMDNAGKAVAQFFCEKIRNPFNQKVVVICGKGNNGGDGVIAHSYLKKYNITSKIVFTEEKHGHSNLIQKYKISKSHYSVYSDKIIFNKYDWVIDGIFGVGLSRKLNQKYQKIITNLNNIKNILSIDIPSGLFTDSDKSKYFINSKYVITFGYPKLGHFLNPINSIYTKDINFIELNHYDFVHTDYWYVKTIVKKFIKNTSNNKYCNKVFILAGSKEYPGAAILSSRSALKSGSSYVELRLDFDNSNLSELIQSNNPDIILSNSITIDSSLEVYAPCLIGPGITRKINNDVIKKLKDAYLKFIFDAGAFTSFKSISNYPLNSILTPHVGEFKRIFNLNDDVVIDINLFKSIQNKIREKIIILKSFNTFIITNNMIYIMDKGPSLLATAGTGDVLSGILVSLLSQGYSRLEASILGTYLHAEAANYYMNNISKDGMTASDLIECIPHAFNYLRNND